MLLELELLGWVGGFVVTFGFLLFVMRAASDNGSIGHGYGIVMVGQLLFGMAAGIINTLEKLVRSSENWRTLYHIVAYIYTSIQTFLESDVGYWFIVGLYLVTIAVFARKFYELWSRSLAFEFRSHSKFYLRPCVNAKL